MLKLRVVAGVIVPADRNQIIFRPVQGASGAVFYSVVLFFARKNSLKKRSLRSLCENSAAA
jgi:hypothetical protein